MCDTTTCLMDCQLKELLNICINLQCLIKKKKLLNSDSTQNLKLH